MSDAAGGTQDDLNGMFKKVNEFSSKVKGVTDSIQGSFSKVTGVFSNFGDGAMQCTNILNTLNIGSGISDQLMDFTGKIQGVVDGIGQAASVFESLGALSGIVSNLLGPMQTFYTSIQVLFASMMDGSGIATGLSAVFGQMCLPIIAVVAAVAAIGAGLLYLWNTSESFQVAVTEALSSLMGILQNIYNSILLPLFELISSIFNTVLVPIGVFLADVFIGLLDVIMAVLLSLWNDVLAPVADFLINILGIALKGIVDVWNSWQPAIQLIFDALQGVWDNVLKPIADWLKEVFIKSFESFKDIVDVIFPAVEAIFQHLIDFLVGIFTLDLDTVWKSITGIFQTFSTFITGIFTTDWSDSFGFFGDVINGFFTYISDIWQSIHRIFAGIIDFVTGIFTNDWGKAWNGVKNVFFGIFDGLSTIIKAPLNAVIGVFNGLLKGINWCIDKINSISIKLPSFLGGAHIGFNIPRLSEVPYLARGGIITKPMQAWIGESGQEAVLPLENNTGWMSRIAYGISSVMQGGHGEDMNDLLILIQELIDIVRHKETNPVIMIDHDSLNRMNHQADRLLKLRTG